MTAHVRPALVSLLLLSVITGVAYPLLVTGDRPGRLSRTRPTAASSCTTAASWARR